MSPRTDPEARQLARTALTDLFEGIGRMRGGEDTGSGSGGDVLSGLTGQLEEFMSMPLDLAMVFINMSVELTDAVLTALEQAGVVLVKGLTPA